MPRRLIATAPRKTAIVSYDERPLGRDEVHVAVDFASPKHGSELAGFRGESPHIKEQYNEDWTSFLPREDEPGDPFNGHWVLGNQWVGRIIELGEDVNGFEIGERVAGHGGIAETLVQNVRDLHKMPAEMSWQNAVCYDPAQFALGGIRDSGLKLGDRAAIIGLGAIGQVAAQLAKLAGASYVGVIDPIEKRRKVALESGADAAFDPTAEDAGLELKRQTDKAGVDVIIETSAAESALQCALRGIAFGGTIAYVGWARAFKGGLDLGREAHFNNANIVFSRAVSEPLREYPRWSSARINSTCWELLSHGKLSCEKIIDPVVSFEESDRAYEEFVDQHPERSIKLGVRF